MRILNGLADHVQSAIHVCGEEAREIINTGQSRLDCLTHRRVRRFQVNSVLPSKALVGILRAATLGALLNKGVIFQARNDFPDAETPQGAVVQWLFDQSGGRGRMPDQWPYKVDHAPKRIGYAGGLNPNNVIEAIKQITRGWPSGLFDHNSRSYWLDMESGIRTNDRFDVAKCRAVCEAVYRYRD